MCPWLPRGGAPGPSQFHADPAGRRHGPVCAVSASRVLNLRPYAQENSGNCRLDARGDGVLTEQYDDVEHRRDAGTWAHRPS